MKQKIKETPRTNELMQKLQDEMIPFESAFWHLLELTRQLEIEVTRLKRLRKKDKMNGVVAKRPGTKA